MDGWCLSESDGAIGGRTDGWAVSGYVLWPRDGWSLELVQPHSSRLSELGEQSSAAWHGERWTVATRWQQKLVVLWFVEALEIGVCLPMVGAGRNFYCLDSFWHLLRSLSLSFPGWL